MRVLLTTRGSTGHVTPLAPLGHALRRAGHDVLVAAQRVHEANVARAGLPFAPVDGPAPEAWMPLMADFAQLDVDAANERMVGEFFARLDTAAALPGLEAIADGWRPDVIVRESWEYASTLVAEARDVPLVRVGLGLAAVEELSIRLAAPAVDEARTALGLPGDPDGDRLRATPYLTSVPDVLEDPAVPAPRATHRFQATVGGGAPPLPDLWPGNDDPLVYVTFGTVTAGGHLPYFPHLYRAAIAALAALPVRVLLTVGEPRALDELGPRPANVHVEHWVAQDAVAPHAAVVVSHGGHGSTLGALAHGVPLVVLPLFSADQWANAEAVARLGAGLALTGHRAGAKVLDLPPEPTFAALAEAVSQVLGDPAHARRARRAAAAMRALPPVDAAVEVIAEARDGRRPAETVQPGVRDL